MASGKGRNRKEKDADSSVSDKDKPYACESEHARRKSHYRNRHICDSLTS